MKNIRFILSVILIISLAACQTQTSNENENQADGDLNSFLEKVKQVQPELKRPGDVAAFLEMTGASFMPELVHDPLANEKYLGNPIMASANMGLYLVDAMYQWSYDERFSAYKSAMAAKALGIDLGLGDVFDEMLIDRYEEDSAPDSVFIKMDRNLVEAGRILTEEERIRVYVAMLAGNYTEKLYLSFSILFEYPDDDLPEEAKLLVLRQLLIVLSEQLGSVDDMIALIKEVQIDTDPGIFLDDMISLSETIKKVNFGEDRYTMTADMIFDNEDIKEMYEKVKKMRKYITDGEIPTAQE